MDLVQVSVSAGMLGCLLSENHGICASVPSEFCFLDCFDGLQVKCQLFGQIHGFKSNVMLNGSQRPAKSKSVRDSFCLSITASCWAQPEDFVHINGNVVSCQLKEKTLWCARSSSDSTPHLALSHPHSLPPCPTPPTDTLPPLLRLFQSIVGINIQCTCATWAL